MHYNNEGPLTIYNCSIISDCLNETTFCIVNMSMDQVVFFFRLDTYERVIT